MEWILVACFSAYTDHCLPPVAFATASSCEVVRKTYVRNHKPHMRAGVRATCVQVRAGSLKSQSTAPARAAR